jgi:hypothetical protein
MDCSTLPPLAANPDEKTSNLQTYLPHRNTDTGQPVALGNGTDPWTPSVPLGANGQTYRQNLGGQVDSAGKNVKNSKFPPSLAIDLAENIKGMYRLLDLIGEPGSNGRVEKVIIAQDSLKRFVNGICSGSYASVTKVDFKALDKFVIKPLGVYGSKVEIVRLLRSLNAVNEDIARLLLAPTELGDSRPALSSGLYVLAAGQVDPIQECHYVIYWPEDSTWNDSATASVCRNRIMFMRYLTKMCDQVIALLSAEHSASIFWGDADGDAKSVDLDTVGDDRLFLYEVAKRNEQEVNIESRPGFKMNSRHISRYAIPATWGRALDPSSFVPTLFHGETAQGFWTVTYVPQAIRSCTYDRYTFTTLSLRQLLRFTVLLLDMMPTIS